MQGMNLEVMNGVVAGLAEEGHRTSDCVSRIDRMLTGIPWRGDDANRLQDDWRLRLRPVMVTVSKSLTDLATTLKQQVEAQRNASDGYSASNAIPDGSPPATPSQGLDRRIAEDWAAMSDEERERVLTAMAQAYAAEYGVDMPRVEFPDLPDPAGLNLYGQWNEGSKTVQIDSSDLSDTRILNTLAHEMRHAGQYEMVRDANPAWWDQIFINLGWKEDPWQHPGVTREQAKEWGDNFQHYKTAARDGYEAYRNQPVELDARTTAESKLNNMTYEEFNSYR